MFHPRRDESRVILIGTATYQNYPDIQAVRNNLQVMREVLSQAEVGGFDERHCHGMTDFQSPERLAEHLQSVAAEATDILVVYLSGIGVAARDGELWFALQRTNPKNLHYTALPLTLVQEGMKSSPARIKILIVECSHSGRALHRSTVHDSISHIVPGKDRETDTYVLTACSEKDITWHLDDDELTPFTAALTQLLREPHKDHPDGLPVGAIFELLRQKMLALGLPEPQQHGEYLVRDLVLVGNSGRPSVDGADLTGGPSGGTGQLPWVSGTTSEPAVPPPENQEEALTKLLDKARHVAGAASRVGDEAESESQDCRDPTPVYLELDTIITEMLRLAGPEHEKIMEVRDLQGSWYARAGRLPDARMLHERLLETRQARLGLQHADVLTTRHHLANVIGLMGDQREAVERLQVLVDDRREVLGEAHPDTLTSTAALAHWTGKTGNPVSAAQMYGSLYDHYAWQHGTQALLTLRVQEELVTWLDIAGNVADALEACDKLIEAWRASGRPNPAKFQEKRDSLARKVQDER
ncbi:tetratricopeptide repeat protein [Actinomadura decatromicini]|uniref:Tetratricopeptide repeat protein n=1 Tax=Actinomadura decatromicini TaxID=2604572 RepID=A0A5D3FTF3_9ACTN|nr:tetratricopeptide repeat protein [Actinomadura decatromicini]TYK51364.1 tetratricopeptide repeat protein [Actinomadura decatromicini]